jgi:CDP-glycerol glycerophosphotransferase (TagB/SpsB family)
MAVYNKEKYVGQAIESIVKQSLDFKKNIQLILVDDKSSDNTLNVLEKYQNQYPENITLINNEKNSGPSYSRNRGLEHVNAKYVNFLDSDDIISSDAFKLAYEFLESNGEVDIVSIPIYYFGVKNGPHSLNFKYEKDQIINLLDNPEYIQLSGASSFFRFEKLKKFSFNENLRVSEDVVVINKMLLDNPRIGFLSKPKYNYRKDGTQNSLITSSANTKSYFTSRMDEYFLNLLYYSRNELGEVPKFIQYVLMYDLQWILEIKFIDYLLDKDEIKTLYDKIQEILTYIDEDVILNQVSIPARLKAHTILIKRHGWHYLMDTAKFTDNFKLDTMFIDNIQFLNDHEIKIDGIFKDFTKDTQIYAVVDGKRIASQKVNYPQRDSYSLNYKYGFVHNFRVTVPFESDSVISFCTDNIDLNIDYHLTSRLSKIGKYKISKNHLAIDEENRIRIAEKKISTLARLEFKTLKEMLKDRQRGWRTGVVLRILYVLTYPFLNNRSIWIFMDLPNAAGDNGLELFKYVSKQDTKSKNYFVLNKTPEDEIEFLTSSTGHRVKKLFGMTEEGKQYRQIKKIGSALDYRSLKHRLYALFAEFIITSHPDNQFIYPFWGNYPHVSGLAHSKTVCLQHGVIKDDISSWANEFNKPVAMFLTSAQREADSFKDHDYGYGPEIIKVLGLPRFDSLEDTAQKRVVLMPSWRLQFEDISDEAFMKTEFYRVYNELINDTELLDFMSNKGYTLVFKPHRRLAGFIHTFEKPSSVIFDTDFTNYRETFNGSSLLITDYSSVFFDFAYLEKPIIYYQEDDSYHFDQDKSYFKYDIDGFGPVTDSYDEVKRLIINYIENGCQMEDVYKKRVEEFFKYHDRNNSKRVYEEILKLDTYY